MPMSARWLDDVGLNGTGYVAAELGQQGKSVVAGDSNLGSEVADAVERHRGGEDRAAEPPTHSCLGV